MGNVPEPQAPPAERIAAVCRVLGRLGLTREPAGHVSMRLPDGRVAVKSRGAGEAGLRFTTASDIVVVEPDGSPADESGPKPPQELAIHLAIYRARPDVGAVVHVHPLATVLATIVDLRLEPLIGAYDPYAVRLLAKGVPTFERSVLVTDPLLGDELAAVLGRSAACLMRGHGATTAGSTPEEAGLNMIKVSELIEVSLAAARAGSPRRISETDHATIVGDGGTRPELVASAWDYYVRLTEEGV